MAEITNTGITIKRLDELVEEFSQGFRSIYGQNINLAPDSPDGQIVGVLAQIQADNEEVAETIYKQLDPDFATGAWLEQRVAYAGLVRRSASYSYLRSAILTGAPNTALTEGIVVSDPNKVRWILNSAVTLNEVGSARADFRSEELGVFSLPEDTTLTIETVTLGLDSVTTSEVAQLGQEEETDGELRERFFISRTRNAENSLEAIYSAISDLPDVKSVVILENTLDYTDENDVPAHSLNVIVEGGDSTAIAQAIAKNKGGGTGLKGETQVTLNIAGADQIYRFDRAVNVDISVYLDIVRYEDGTEINKDELKSVLSSVNFSIGKDVPLSRLYSPINTVGGFWVRELKIGRNGQSLLAENVDILPREKARILSQDIVIEVE